MRDETADNPSARKTTGHGIKKIKVDYILIKIYALYFFVDLISN